MLDYIVGGYILIGLITAAHVYNWGDSQEVVDRLEKESLGEVPKEYRAAYYYAGLTIGAVMMGAIWPISVTQKVMNRLRR